MGKGKTVSFLVGFLALAALALFLSFHEGNTAQAGGGDVSTTSIWVAMAPLEDNLTLMFQYQGKTKGWLFFNPTYPAGISTLRQLEVGKAYWVQVSKDQAVSLCGTQYTFEAGWNNFAWMTSC